MWGADDPDERKPMVWSDLEYEDEVAHPFGRPRHRDRVVPDTTLLGAYRQLVALRRERIRLFADGALNWLLADDARRLLAYERVLGNARAIVAFNASDQSEELMVEVASGSWTRAFPRGEAIDVTGDTMTMKLSPRTATVWVRE